MVLHELDDDSDVAIVVFDADHPHDVRSVFGVRITAVFVGQYKTGVRLVDFHSAQLKLQGFLKIYGCKTKKKTVHHCCP